MNKKQGAFTLVELIVVITILAILGTIVFIVTTANIKSSRDAVRITDIGIIEQSLGIFHIGAGKYPMPSDYTEVTYSGGTLWYQGSFGESTFINLSKISEKPIDPLFENEYDYSLTNNKKKYQLAAVLESDDFLGLNIVSQVNALSSKDVLMYVTGDYGLYDLNAQNAGSCFLVSVPSLFISDSSFTGLITNGGTYNFVYNNSNNITKNYQNKLSINSTGKTFQVKEVYNKCSIDSIDELNLYISKLSLNYQQLNGEEQFNPIIYDFNTYPFKQGAIENLLLNGIKVSKEVVDSVNDPSAGNIFKDTFTASDSTILVGSYSPDTFGSWTKTGAIVSGSYLIVGNQLTKTDNLTGTISPVPILPITSRDKTIIFDIEAFAGGSIFVYTNYIDQDNFYGIELDSSGYQLIHYVGGVENSPYPSIVSEPILVNSQIELSVSGNNIKFFINGIEKENIIDGSAIFEGNPAIEMTKQNAKIDNYTLIYR